MVSARRGTIETRRWIVIVMVVGAFRRRRRNRPRTSTSRKKSYEYCETSFERQRRRTSERRCGCIRSSKRAASEGGRATTVFRLYRVRCEAPLSHGAHPSGIARKDCAQHELVLPHPVLVRDGDDHEILATADRVAVCELPESILSLQRSDDQQQGEAAMAARDPRRGTALRPSHAAAARAREERAPKHGPCGNKVGAGVGHKGPTSANDPRGG